MQLRRQSSAQRPLLVLAAHRGVPITSRSPLIASSNAVGKFSGPLVHSYQPIDLRRIDGRRAGEGGSSRIQTEPDKSWRVVPAAIFGFSARFFGGFAACGEFAFSGFLFAFMSWTIAEVLAGCAAYAQAMYPCVIEDEPRERLGIAAPTTSEPVALPPTRGYRSVAADPVVVAYIVRSETPRVDPPRWSALIAGLWREFRSEIGREIARRRAIAELRALDDRSLRDVGLSRCDIDRVARYGDRCE